MKVYLCQRDDECSDCCGLSAFAVCSTLDKCKEECVKDLIESNRTIKSFNFGNCVVGEIEDGTASDLKELKIIDYSSHWNTITRYEIWEMEIK